MQVTFSIEEIRKAIAQYMYREYGLEGGTIFANPNNWVRVENAKPAKKVK